jgi:hypothetical protein
MLDHLKLLVRAGHPVVGIETRDEEEAVRLVRSTAEALGVNLFEWATTTGLKRTRPSRADSVLMA